jgi:hypothetical protein
VCWGLGCDSSSWHHEGTVPSWRDHCLWFVASLGYLPLFLSPASGWTRRQWTIDETAICPSSPGESDISERKRIYTCLLWTPNVAGLFVLLIIGLLYCRRLSFLDLFSCLPESWRTPGLRSSICPSFVFLLCKYFGPGFEIIHCGWLAFLEVWCLLSDKNWQICEGIKCSCLCDDGDPVIQLQTVFDLCLGFMKFLLFLKSVYWHVFLSQRKICWWGEMTGLGFYGLQINKRDI